MLRDRAVKQKNLRLLRKVPDPMQEARRRSVPARHPEAIFFLPMERQHRQTGQGPEMRSIYRRPYRMVRPQRQAQERCHRQAETDARNRAG